MRYEAHVPELCCTDCAAAIGCVVEVLPGVTDVECDVATHTVVVGVEGTMNAQWLSLALAEAGYTCADAHIKTENR